MGRSVAFKICYLSGFQQITHEVQRKKVQQQVLLRYVSFHSNQKRLAMQKPSSKIGIKVPSLHQNHKKIQKNFQQINVQVEYGRTVENIRRKTSISHKNQNNSIIDRK